VDARAEQQRLKLALLCLLAAFLVRPSHQVRDEAATDEILSFNNFGVYFIRRGAAYVTSETWHHIFQFVLPACNSKYPQSRGVNCSKSNVPTQDRNLCTCKADVTNVYAVRTAFSIDILPDTSPDKLKGRCSFFDLGSTILSKIFGLSTESDLRQIMATVNEMRRTSAEVAHALQVTPTNV